MCIRDRLRPVSRSICAMKTRTARNVGGPLHCIVDMTLAIQCSLASITSIVHCLPADCRPLWLLCTNVVLLWTSRSRTRISTAAVAALGWESVVSICCRFVMQRVVQQIELVEFEPKAASAVGVRALVVAAWLLLMDWWNIRRELSSGSQSPSTKMSKAEIYDSRHVSLQLKFLVVTSAVRQNNGHIQHTRGRRRWHFLLFANVGNVWAIFAWNSGVYFCSVTIFGRVVRA